MNPYSIKVVLYFDPNYRKPDRNIIYAKIQGVMVYSPCSTALSICMQLEQKSFTCFKDINTFMAKINNKNVYFVFVCLFVLHLFQKM